MESKKLSRGYIKLMLFTFVMALLLAVPFCAQAAAHYEDETYSGGDMYYVDTKNEEYWVVSNNKWHQCEIFDSTDNLELASSKVRSAMLNRDSSIAFYLVTDNANYNQKAGATSSNDLNNQSIKSIFDVISEEVYIKTDNPASGDYLRMMSECLNSGSYRLSVSDQSEAYSFYYISASIGNNSSAHQEEQVAQFVSEWNQQFIDSNSQIASSTGDERQYYIVKTIYNFICKNTAYHTDLYKDFNHSKYPVDGVEYINAHTAYGALFGNIIGSMEDDFEYLTVTTNSREYKYDLSANVDAQGLDRIVVKNQGKAVCDGYSLLFYYMCQYNGIDCKIITGDHVDTATKGSDPHAWNMVYLKDYLDKDYEWYAVDTTFASQMTQKISNEFTAVNYDYYLRGSEDTAFDADNHQQAYDQYANTLSKQSPENYRFNITNIDASNLNVFVSRRRSADASELYVQDGVYNLENYMIIDPNNNHFKINDEKNALLDADGFIYYGTGYYYSFELYDFAKGVEYTCTDRYLLDAGDYSFDVHTVYGNKVYSKVITIAPLDMSSWSTYDLKASTINGNEFSDAFDENNNLNINAQFIGAPLDIKTEIFDSTDKQLVEGKDYKRVIYVKGDSKKTPVSIKDPNSYVISFEYMGNYKGTVEVPFILDKADIGNYKFNIDSRYGDEIGNYISNLNLGNSNGTTSIKKGTDFEIVSITGGLNYGDTGVIKIRGLASSKYIQAGSTSDWTYKVATQRDMSSTFKNMVIKNETYCTTGSPIEPTTFTMAYLKSDGTRVDLVKDKDYKITGYSNNVKAGTGYVNVSFIGNYTGTATLSFTIVASTPTISSTKFTYNGNVQRPSVTIKDANGNQLVYKTDFTVDYDNWSSTDAGSYNMYIKYIGAYSGTQTVAYTISPAAATVTASNLSFVYNGSVQKPSFTVKDSSGKALTINKDYTVSYSNASSKELGTYTATVTMSNNYTGSKSFTYTIATCKHNVVTDRAVAATCTADGKTDGSHCSLCGEVIVAQKTVTKLGHNVVTDKATSPTCTAAGKTEGSHCSRCNAVIKAQTSIPALGHKTELKNVVKATCTADGNTGDQVCTVCNAVVRRGTVVPKSATIKKSAVSFTYDGKVHRPSIYVYDRNGKALTYKTDFTVEYTNWNSTNPGTYYVTIRMIGNYDDVRTYAYTINCKTHSQTYKKGFVAATCTADGYTGDSYCGVCGAKVASGKAIPKSATIKKSAVTFAYDGKVHRPSIYVYDKNGKALTYKTDFTVEYSYWNSANAGAYKVTIKMIGNYNDSRTYTYTITPATKVTAKLSRNTFTYNGAVQIPTASVTDASGKVLTLNKDFTVTYSNSESTAIGRYTATVKMMGNYSGTYTYAYYINPKTVEFLSSAQGGFKAIKNGFTIKWNKQTSDDSITGYQIQYSTRSDFVNAASVWVENPDTVTKTISGRAGGTRYYVRIRAYTKIGNGTFYGSWNSGTKSIVTLK